MKKIAAAALITCLILTCLSGLTLARGATVSSGVTAGNAYVPQGTLIDTELITAANSRDFDVNDVVYFRTLQTLAVDGVVIVPSGSVGQAVVTAVRPAGFFGQGGGIEIRAKYVQALNGAIIPLTLDVKQEGRSNLLFVPFAAMVLRHYEGFTFKESVGGAGLIHGAEADVPSGTKLQVAVQTDADLGCTNSQLPYVMVKALR
ncbi:MAG: hypothetical protein P4N41_04890 [Negativicutes bacterium]|nr:hypothetical protein [Negativicutes bacterium]